MLQLTANEFTIEMDRLHRAFGSKSNEVVAEKIEEWFELWQQLYAETSGQTLAKMVNLAIKKSERLPSFAQFIAFRAEVTGEAKTYPTLPCSVCNATGLIHSDKAGYSYAWRCHCCENWRGKYEGLPVWSQTALADGHVIRQKEFKHEEPQKEHGNDALANW